MLNMTGPVVYSPASDLVLFLDEMMLVDTRTGDIIGKLQKPSFPDTTP